MGRHPSANAKEVFTMSTEKWKNKDKELIELVKQQAGISKTLVETQVAVDKIASPMPTPAEFEEL